MDCCAWNMRPKSPARRPDRSLRDVAAQARPGAAVPGADPVPSHRAVLDAVRDQDPARAERAMVNLLAKAVADLDHLTRVPDVAPRS